MEQQVALQSKKLVQGMEAQLRAMEQNQRQQVEEQVQAKLAQRWKALQRTSNPTSSRRKSSGPRASGDTADLVRRLHAQLALQDQQLEEAKHLLNSALTDREEAAATAGQAVELTMQLDRTLQQAYVEIDELRQALRRRTSPTLPSELTEHAHESSKPVRYTC